MQSLAQINGGRACLKRVLMGKLCVELTFLYDSVKTVHFLI
jgi:hypothetical protein